MKNNKIYILRLVILFFSASCFFSPGFAYITPEKIMEKVSFKNIGTGGEGKYALFKSVKNEKDEKTKEYYRSEKTFLFDSVKKSLEAMPEFMRVEQWIGEKKDKVLVAYSPKNGRDDEQEFSYLTLDGEIQPLFRVSSTFSLSDCSPKGDLFILYKQVKRNLSTNEPILNGEMINLEFYIVRKQEKNYSKPIKISMKGQNIKGCSVSKASEVYCLYCQSGNLTYLSGQYNQVAKIDGVTGKGTPVISEANSAIMHLKRSSPNGKYLLFEGFFDKENPENFRSNIAMHLYVLNKKGEVIQTLESQRAIGWLDGHTFVTHFYKNVHSKIGIYDVMKGEIETVPLASKGLHSVCPISVNIENANIISFLASSPNLESNIYKYDRRTKEITQITEKKDFFGPEDTSDEIKYDVIKWPTDNGEMIEGILLYPKNDNKEKKYPLLVELHGGPPGVFSLHNMDGWKLYTDRGYFVLLPNVRGSLGYGKKFLTQIRKNLGIWDATDVLYGIKYLESEGYIDSNRVSLQGYSYGGNLAAQLISKHPKFRSAAIGAGITDYFNKGLTDSIWVPTAWLGDLKQYVDLWIERSPIIRAKDVKTPTLFYYGNKDGRVSPLCSKSMALILKENNVPIEVIESKDSSHNNITPEARYQYLKEKLQFHLKWNPPDQK